MLDILNAFFLVATVTSQALHIVARAESDIKRLDDVRVYAVTLKQQAPLWADKCRYEGLMVQYARDWEETQQPTGMVLPPEPDKPIGYAVILNKEQCPGKEERAILSVDEKPFYPFARSYVIREGHRIDAVDYVSQREDMRPKWMQQVLKTIEADAPNNIAAQHFLAAMQARMETAKATGAAAGAPAAPAPTRKPDPQNTDAISPATGSPATD